MELNEILSCWNRNEDRWKKLKGLYENSKIIPFIGAGMSTPVYPMWSDAIRNILNGDKKEVDELNELFDQNKYEDACEYVKEKINNNGFIERVRSEFSENKINKSSEIERGKVNSNCLPDIFNGPIFTTNFDKMLEHCYNNNFDNIYSLSNMTHSWAVIYDAIRNYNHNLYKIHGDIDDVNSWVFSRQQYEDVYGREEFLKVIRTVCESMNFLFMGCSLTESDRYINVLSEVVESFSDKQIIIQNFAFISLPNGENKTMEDLNREIELKDRHLSGMGILPIWYPYGQHEVIPVLLKALKNKSIVTSQFPKDKTRKAKHFNLFSSNLHVCDAFVDDCFESYSYDSSLARTDTYPINLNEIVELIKTNNLVFIEGKYGSGKTVLSIRVQWELKKNYDTLFFKAEDFYENEEIFEMLNTIERKCYVIIDGIDKLVDNSINLDNLDNLCEMVDAIINANNNISFILNSRIYCRINSTTSDKNELISMYVALAMQRDNLIVIKTKGFFEKSKYERFFENIGSNYNNRLTSTIIKQWHKKSPLSCQVPLFAYVIGEYYYNTINKKTKNSDSGENVLPDNKMIIYEGFIRKTIKGRFQEESLNGTINEDLYAIYESLLRKIAIRMIHEMRKSIDYSEDVFTAQEFSDKEIYAIDVKDFDEELQISLRELLDKSKKKEGILSDAINNYFFYLGSTDRHSNTIVRFSDINVMCCFAAAYIFDVIGKIVKYDSEKHVEEHFGELKIALGWVELQPQVMDFLMCKIQELSAIERKILLNNILVYIKKYNQTQDVSEENVRAMLVLYIIFIKCFQNSYKSIGMLNFFKTFYRLCMTAKALNINGEHCEGGHRYLAERYFMDCSFIEYEFKRLNYKYYNFSRSHIINCSFEQCNFLDNEFVNTELRDSKFRLCTLKTKFKKTIIEGNIKIENSIINEANFEAIEVKNINNTNNINNIKGTIHFKGCTMLNMIIHDTDAKGLKILLEDCILGDIKIKKCKRIGIEIKECIKKKEISIDPNSLIYSNQKSFFSGSVKSLDYFENNF